MESATRTDSPTRPNILLIVMDCVRASDFPGGGPDPPTMPFVERLRRQSVSFPRAASVAPWTLPSHASMFTGVYPWEHGCHGRGSLTLDPRFECLASVLRGQGYGSSSISGNPIISPYYGLVNGFDVAHWGEWWEQLYRFKPSPSHSYKAEGEGRTPEVPPLSFRYRAGRTVKTIATRLPAPLALSEAVARHTLDPYGRGVGTLNPWIEPMLLSWLTGQPRDRPTFTFVNLIDAHEPYLLDPMDSASFRDWWRYMRIPQDVLALLARQAPPSREDLGRLHSLYRKAIAAIDRRLERIVEVYRDAGRWENTLLILTSDHGQAFGEHGMIWHGVRTDEEMLRVPLLMRLPGDELAGMTATGWASPMDAMSTALEAAGIYETKPGSGVPLRRVIDAPRPTPLYSAGDGTEWNRPFMEALTPQRRSELNLYSIAAYVGSTKIVVDATTGMVRGYDLGSDSPTQLPPSQLERPDLLSAIDGARRAASALLHPSSPTPSAEVDKRLRSWGYG